MMKLFKNIIGALFSFVLLLAIFNPLVFGFGAMVGGSSDVVVETEADYTVMRGSFADGQSWFTADNLGNNLFDQDGGSGGTGDKGGFNLVDLRLAEVATGSLIVGKIYEISARTDQDFTADGAPDNVVGTTFTATGTNVALDVNNKVYPIDISWDNYETNQVSIDSDTLKITWVDHAYGAAVLMRSTNDLSADLVVGQLYKLQLDAKVGAGNSVSLHDGIDEFITITNTEFQTFKHYFVSISATGHLIRMTDMGAGEILWLDNLTLQAVTSPADFADSGFLVQVTDGSGKKASGYIGEAGTGETLGIELLSNPSFDANTTGWGSVATSTVDSVAGGVSNNALRITEDGTASSPYVTQNVTVSANKEYIFGVWRKQGTEIVYKTYISVTTYSDFGQKPNADATAVWVRGSWYGVMFDASEQIILLLGATKDDGTTIFFDEASVKEITEPNPNSVKIYKEPHLATEGWLSIDGSFDPNDIVSFIIFG